MRSADELRQRWLDEVSKVVARPGMWARNGPEMDMVCRTLLGNLCFLDERDQDHDEIHRALRRFGKLGVHGPFTALFGREANCIAEVASVFAEQFHRLGYLTVDRLLDPGEWTTLTRGLRDRFEDRDMRRSEVEALLGTPSLVIDKRVLCYAPTGAGAWLFIDCWAETRTVYVPGKGQYDGHRDGDPLVRSVRSPAGDFESGLILTLYGKLLRWGPGWWLHHPPAGASAVTLAIAAQLRDVEACDPSQALTDPPPGQGRR